MKRAAVVLLAAALVLAGAGCGGSGGGRLSKGEYESRLRTLAKGLTGDLADFAAVEPSDLGSAPAFLGRLANTLDRFAKSLDAIEAPGDVSILHARLVEGARSAAKQIRALAGKLAGAGPAKAKKLLAQFNPARLHGLAELQAAAAAIAARGYRISSSGGT